MNLNDHMQNLWKWISGKEEITLEDYSLDRLRETEWSPTFEQLMRNRLVQGAFRYGLLNRKHLQYNRIEAIIERAKQYSNSGNLELLVDIANFALLEFEEGKHPTRHFKTAQTKKVRNRNESTN